MHLAPPMLVLASLSPGARAGDGVLWYEGHAGYDADAPDLESAVLAAGATAFDDSATWPKSLGDYRLIFLVAPSVAFSAAEVVQLDSWVAGGGTLVLLGDNENLSASLASVLTALLSDMGLGSSYVSDQIDAGCSHWATVESSHPLTDGLSTGPVYASTCDITLSSDATLLLSGDSGQTVLAVEGNVVLSSDLNMFNDSCTLTSDNITLMENLFEGFCSEVTDSDGDGYDSVHCEGDDCDDDNPDTYPGAPELCDGQDNDCDGAAGEDETDADDDGLMACEDCDDGDPDVAEGYVWYLDQDGDGYGTLAKEQVACEQPSGFADNAADCDDQTSSSYPGADEYCDDRDNDCDGSTDEGDAVDATTWYLDQDGDGYGATEDATTACEQPTGHSEAQGDCDDAKASIHPEAVEICNGWDDVCDDLADNDAQDAITCYPDADGDGWGDATGAVERCSCDSGYVSSGDDCDDADPDAWPGAPGWTADCEPEIDEQAPEDTSEPSEDRGCGCATGPSGLELALPFLLALVPLVRRRGEG